MGCFLACFGFSKKRGRRKLANKLLSEHHSHGSYQPLDSDVSVSPTKFDISGNPNSSESEFSKGKGRSSLRIKKKVSFNLNVKAYEPLPNPDFSSHLSDSDDERCLEKKEDSGASETSNYPPGHRYQNCRDSFDEEDGIELEDSDNNGDDSDENDEDYDSADDGRMSQEEELAMESENRVESVELDREMKRVELNFKAARDRNQYVVSVLNPVENLTQWRAVKARAAAAPPPVKKENIPSPTLNYKPNHNQPRPVMAEITVDASLSNWLISTKTESINTVPIKHKQVNQL
ncbi:uncharacterized protein LOC127812194 isoform X2 [Diospyros lotus]|uniref:uncharacterized protein LOC127812194 isoform X2 n=1 Tax=Diospyros lotus TaxID=55363 RepID=UPI002259F998|nr:uncharacterized protein LOC127812194 isoform X2 [Diospyros lotus]